MLPLSITILEDENVYMKQLIQELNCWSRKNDIAVSIRSFSNGKDLLREEFDDNEILFFDIDLKALRNGEKIDKQNGKVICSQFLDMNGLDIAKRLRENGFHGTIIFLTAFSEYVFQGYNVQAHDFLLKPIDADKLAKCLQPIVKGMDSSFHIYQFRDEMFKIPYNKILAFSAYKHYVDIATLIPVSNQDRNSYKTFRQRISVKELESQLPEEFIRCHRSVIINANKIISITKTEAVLIGDVICPISESYLEGVREAFVRVLGC